MSQPVKIYPTPFPTQRPAPSHHSNGSFGTVFIVLTVIVVVSVAACFLGRLRNRRHNHSKGKHSQADFCQKERETNKNNATQPRQGDIEFGFDKRFSSAKVAASEEFRGGPKAFHNGAARRGGDIEFGFDKRFPSAKGAANGPKAFHNGQSRKEMRFADDGELKPGA